MTSVETGQAPYDALAAVYDRWTAGAEHDRWAEFIGTRLGDDVRSVLDVCCGTGLLTHELRERGYRATGVDRSPAMLEIARWRLGPEVPLHRATLPAFELDETVHAAVCAFDSVNYFSPANLTAAFTAIARTVDPGGLFIFDVNTRTKLESVFGSSHYGDDQGDFSYVWRNRLNSTTSSVEFLITLFERQDGDHFRRRTEHHVQYWYSHVDIRSALEQAGFTDFAVCDDYRDVSVSDKTMRETWVVRRR